MSSNSELEPWKRDQRFLYWKLKQQRKEAPDSSDAEAFAERVAVKMESMPELSEQQARDQAYTEYLNGKKTHENTNELA